MTKANTDQMEQATNMLREIYRCVGVHLQALQDSCDKLKEMNILAEALCRLVKEQSELEQYMRLLAELSGVLEQAAEQYRLNDHQLSSWLDGPAQTSNYTWQALRLKDVKDNMQDIHWTEDNTWRT